MRSCWITRTLREAERLTCGCWCRRHHSRELLRPIFSTCIPTWAGKDRTGSARRAPKSGHSLAIPWPSPNRHRPCYSGCCHSCSVDSGGCGAPSSSAFVTPLGREAGRPTIIIGEVTLHRTNHGDTPRWQSGGWSIPATPESQAHCDEGRLSVFNSCCSPSSSRGTEKAPFPSCRETTNYSER